MKRTFSSEAAGLLVAVVCAQPAAASTFDSATGRLALDGAVEASLDSLEATPDDTFFYFYDVQSNELSAADAAALFETNPDGLEGSGALRIGGEIPFAYLVLNLDPKLTSRRVEIRFWQRPQGTRTSLSLNWMLDGPAGSHFLGSLTFLPSGRRTDDGWEEWSSGPFDWAMGGLTGPIYLVLTDVQAIAAQDQFIAYDVDAFALLDALEVMDLGPASVPSADCTALNEATACGSDGVCLYGRCVDAAVHLGSVPQDDTIRADYIHRRMFEFRSFEGGRIPQSLMDDFDATVEPLATTAPSSTFWPTLSRAVHDLRDAHASAPMPTYPNMTHLGVCAHLGNADLTGGPLSPLVFSHPATNPVGQALEPGDALVAIDGLPPLEWADVAWRATSYSGDLGNRDYVITPQLIPAAAALGATLTLERCTQLPAAGSPCADADQVTIELDLAELVGADIWDGSPPSWLDDYTACDYRFLRGVSGSGIQEHDFIGFADDAGIRTLLINGVPYSESWMNTAFDALVPAPPLLILDERRGGGGTVSSTDLLAALLISPQDFDWLIMAPWTERPYTEVSGALENCEAFDLVDTCGNSLPWVLGEPGEVGSDFGVAAGTKLAILIGDDVSGNDFLTQLLSYRSEQTRIFGAGPTRGAFGVIWELPSHIDELMGGSFQVHDTIFYPSAGNSSGFTTAIGVPPDEVVLQSQRDILSDVDTAIEAARTWLEEG